MGSKKKRKNGNHKKNGNVQAKLAEWSQVNTLPIFAWLRVPVSTAGPLGGSPTQTLSSLLPRRLYTT